MDEIKQAFRILVRQISNILHRPELRAARRLRRLGRNQWTANEGLKPVSLIVSSHCSEPFESDLRWEVPLRIGLFIVAIILSLVVQILSS